LTHPAAEAFVAEHRGQPALLGAWVVVDLTRLPAGARVSDPVVAAAQRWHAAQKLANGQRVILLRMWLSREHGQAPSPETSFVSAAMTQHSIVQPRLAATLGLLHDAPSRDAFAQATLLHPLPDVTAFTIDGARGFLHVRDWRELPVAAWLLALAGVSPLRVRATHAVAAAHVRAALRVRHQPDLLGRSALAQMLAPAGVVADAARIAQAALTQALAALQQAPADAPLAAALQLAYGDAMGDKHNAALLGLSVSGYRKRLRMGIARICAHLNTLA
jgi:hypothetical protein